MKMKTIRAILAQITAQCIKCEEGREDSESVLLALSRPEVAGPIRRAELA